ncbi:MAG: HAD family hydrolase [Brevefilum sp.]
MIQTVAFDADDTLWQNEALYQEAQARLQEILSPWASQEETHRVLTKTELDNLSLYGYGIKAFTLSMIESALEISQNQINPEKIEQILTLGRSMLQKEVDLLPNVEPVLSTLSRTYRLMVITKGDLLDQTSKIKRSGLQDYFSFVEVLNQKNPPAYRAILDKHNLDVRSFLMVGNSLRSDIAPVLALGGKTVHIPATSTWEHEMLADFDPSHEGYYQIQDIKELPDLIAELDNKAS